MSVESPTEPDDVEPCGDLRAGVGEAYGDGGPGGAAGGRPHIVGGP
ncbi:hypothetical protein [Actinomadura soli]|nr:hypothetical protein [Actinomadura soli]